ncbi:MFS transporter [Corynebacterium sp. ES2794-CONJ1]|uniref:MFS transporter n=1 Tax=unclassified Corynebacterium TaxID=2624378 RepID=UPI0021677908|nr:MULTISPECIES: MFS transporter [unclassified Corynebacterium]MCS4490359.1 MFS transporter [Corynebacterium sp. ES2775-CONJ]MCS4492137.1 MFS transporter [Corynebacterium sp. ES2715-CONJ3]MCS4532379.1 MFS transporter [Corynebacterium sp. ES2730-CONJ]MCU9519658.1 MFS transporter [Corynebacterium sp. ES2794-CONJ1]
MKTSTGSAPASPALNPKAAVPVLLFSFVFCLVVDNGFKTMTGPMAEGLGIAPNVASLQASLAGVIIGIGAVVYAALADSISIRKLMIVGVILTTVGSLMAFFFSTIWPMVLLGRIVQTAGLASAETLYVIYVTKHLEEKDQKTYLGFSTAAFQSGLLIGALTSGFISTYISWTAMFLVPLVLILTVPFLIKNVPEEVSTDGSLDLYGLILIAVFAASLTMFLQAYNPIWLVMAIAGIALFAFHVVKGKAPLVTVEFFKNQRYVWAIALVFIIYSTQLGYIFLLPFAGSDLYGLSQDRSAMLMIPGYVCAIIVGVLSGKIGRVLNSRITILIALASIIAALLLGVLAIEVSIWVMVFSIVLFASGFALLYAPLVKTALSNIPAAKSGIAIGFYNLTINIGIPLGIAYTARLQATDLSYNSILLVLALIAAFGTAMYFMADYFMSVKEKRAA